jgi:DNA-binding transcriptional MocR family regulator
MDQVRAQDRPITPRPPEAVIDLLGPWAAGPEPLFRQLATALGEAIERGDLRPGDRLPPERDLARALSLSRSTVVAALDLLRAEGRLASRQGSGTWVPVRAGSLADDRARVLDDLARNPLVRGVLAPSGPTIELTAAVVPGLPDVVGAAVAAAAEDLPRLIAGHGYAPLGLPALREAIAAHYDGLGLPTRPAEILVTSGAQQAISLLAQGWLEPGAPVLVEDPTYVVALDVFRAAGAELHGVAIGPRGPDPEQLRDRIARTRPAFAYLVPTNQNPTGATTPQAERRQIARIAAETGVLVVEDEAIAGLEFDGIPQAPIAAADPAAPIATIGSLSKRAWGGLRVGWVRAAEPVVARLGRLKVLADYGASLVGQATAVRVMERLPELAAERRAIVTANASLLAGLLATHLPDWTWERPGGGITAWVRIPAGEAGALAQVALRHGVAIVPGPATSVSGSHGDRVRITFGDAAGLEEGIARLGRAWRAYRTEDGGPRDQGAWIV